jgi:hypothetical protein
MTKFQIPGSAILAATLFAAFGLAAMAPMPASLAPQAPTPAISTASLN